MYEQGFTGTNKLVEIKEGDKLKLDNGRIMTIHKITITTDDEMNIRMESSIEDPNKTYQINFIKE